MKKMRRKIEGKMKNRREKGNKKEKEGYFGLFTISIHHRRVFYSFSFIALLRCNI
jgi:hypothetical protein